MPPKKRDKDSGSAAANSTATVVATASTTSSGETNGPTVGAAGGGASGASVKYAAGRASDHRDQIQAEHELFLQAFEKPTQIYRYLRTRNMISPVFLHRTLTYMKHRMSRNNKKRSDFKIDSMLSEKVNKSCLDKTTLLGDYMTLMFLGFYDKTLCEDMKCDDIVRVQTILLKISHKKRKDSSAALMEVNFGTSDVMVNPSGSDENEKIPAISIPVDSFKPLGAPLNRSYILVLRVETLPKYSVVMENDEEPNSKRPKPNTKIYGSELVIFDKHSRCLLAEGEYELALQEIVPTVKNNSPKKYSTWEMLPDETSLEIFEKPDNPFDVFSKCPTLKFCLKWTTELCSGFVDRPKPVIKSPDSPITANGHQADNGADMNDNLKHNNNTIAPIRNGLKESSANAATMVPVKSEEQFLIIYQFIYNNNSRQQTEPCDDLHCPWCSLNCITLYSLLKHLKLCHARFTFTYVPMPNNGARIDVAINDMYDGSYTGSPHDLVGPATGCAFARAGPVRRTSVTNLLVCRPRRQKPSLSEFLELDENELNNQRPYITGHNRLYHHTETCLPVHPKELDVDSEGEGDPLWLQQKTMQMIDEFTDVNEGEKELMKMWNLHVMKHGYVGDCQLPLACDMFLDMRGRDLLQKNLYRNFVLHMCSLFDYGLVSPEVIYKTIQKLQSILSTYPEGRKIISESRETQLNYWLKVGIHKQAQQDEQKLKQQSELKANTGSTSKSNNQSTTINSNSHQKQQQQQTSSESRKLLSSDKDRDSHKSTGLSSLSLNNKRKSISSQTATNNLSSANQSTQLSNKRRISQLRDSPPRRRSAPSSDPPKNPPTRRKSLATFGGGNTSSTVGGNSSGTTSMRKRTSIAKE